MLLQYVNLIDLDSRFSEDDLQEQKKKGKEIKLVEASLYLNTLCEDPTRYARPIPNGEFEIVPIGSDPSKGVKIGVDLLDLAKRQLKTCLRENAYLFAWSTSEMSDLDP